MYTQNMTVNHNNELH